MISSLEINLDKSELILVREVSNVEELVRVVGCKVGALLLLFWVYLWALPSSLFSSRM